MSQESWNSRIGVIMAVAAGSVGLGNFLRFPGQVAQFGGGAFMIAYFISFLIIGLPIGWVEWTIGRQGGKKGFFACPGILNALWKHPLAKYIGVIGTVVPLGIFAYYLYVQGWCLGYAINFLMGKMNFADAPASSNFWANFVGIHNNGSLLDWGMHSFGLFVLIAFAVNILIITIGVSKGIEYFTKKAIPTLIILAFIVLIRVLTLGTPDSTKPDNTVLNGLGFMWNPNKTYLTEYQADAKKWVNIQLITTEQEHSESLSLVNENPNQYQIKKETILHQLQKPALWLAAGGQIFFSLCIGAGVILVYASYMKENDDVVLSNLTSMSTNEFCEVALGGLITIPAAFAFLGAVGVMGQGTFGLGFNVLPLVFSEMPLGRYFGFLFFILLYLASVSGTIAMLQVGLSFFRETLFPDRKKAIKALTVIGALLAFTVCWLTKDIKGLDTVDFWVTNVLMFIMAGAEVILFAWILNLDSNIAEANRGAAFKLPKVFRFVIKYITPLFLLIVFCFWLFLNVFNLGNAGIDYHILDLIGSEENPVNKSAWIGFGLVIALIVSFSIIVGKNKAYKNIQN